MNRAEYSHPEISEVNPDVTRSFGPDFFELQIRFAEQLSRVTEEPVEDCLLNYTSLYKRFGLGSQKDVNNPTWQEFLEGLRSKDRALWAEIALDFYKRCESSKEELENKDSCFSYDYDDVSKTVRIHFDNNDRSGLSPLSEERLSARLSDLKRMFERIKREHPDAEKVKGSSWLYNLNSYRRLFPEEFTSELIINPDGLSGLGTWGQFIGSDGKLKSDMAHAFLDQVAKLNTKEEILDSFKFKKLNAGCEIGHFYKYLGIT